MFGAKEKKTFSFAGLVIFTYWNKISKGRFTENSGLDRGSTIDIFNNFDEKLSQKIWPLHIPKLFLNLYHLSKTFAQAHLGTFDAISNLNYQEKVYQEFIKNTLPPWSFD